LNYPIKHPDQDRGNTNWWPLKRLSGTKDLACQMLGAILGLMFAKVKGKLMYFRFFSEISKMAG
jgi:hypothetical protein